MKYVSDITGEIITQEIYDTLSKDKQSNFKAVLCRETLVHLSKEFNGRLEHLENEPVTGDNLMRISESQLGISTILQHIIDTYRK